MSSRNRCHRIQSLTLKCRCGGVHEVKPSDVKIEGFETWGTADDPDGWLVWFDCPGCEKEVRFDSTTWPNGRTGRDE